MARDGLDPNVPAAPHGADGEERYVNCLKRLNEIARDLLAETSPEVLYQRVADEAKDLLGAAYSALIVLRDGTDDEIEHFAYNAPRELFPDRLPRCVGLLAVPIQTGAPARLDDIRGHAAGVGIPVAHPPVAALLAVPILGPDRVAGELAVANSPGAAAFDAIDEAVLTELAAHAALAISLAAARAAQHAAEQTRVGLTRLALHNLRTPLAVAIGATETLRRGGQDMPDDQRTTLLDMLDRSLERASRVAEEVVIAETGGDAEAPTVEPVDLAALIGDVVEAYEDLAARRAVRLEVELDPELATVLIAAPVVRSALDNLLSNAVRFSPDRERIVITCRAEGHGVRVDVTDHGPGIRPEHQSAIFDGVAAQRPIDDRGGGAGVGLSITRRLLRAAGGQIGVASQPGHGSTFWISVPRVDG